MALPLLHIVLVEDNAGDARLLRELLKESPVFVPELQQFERLAPALEALRASRTDVVLLDLSLPDAQGLEAVTRTHEIAPTVPIVVLTGLDDEATALAAVHEGAQDYLVKGRVDGAVLGRAIRYAIERRRSEEMRRRLVEERAARWHAEQAEQERTLLLARERRARAEADIERERLRSLFMQAPVAIAVWRGPSYLHEIANPLYCTMLGKHDLDGKSVREVFPELEAQGLFAIFDRVYETGVSFVASEFPLRIDRLGDGRLHEGLFNFVLQTTRGPEGEISGLMAVAVEVTEQVLARRQIEASEKMAREAVGSRDDLLATVSHDLRSPLGTVLMASNLLRRYAPAGEGGQMILKHATNIERAANRMTRLIQDLLDITSIEGGHLSLEPSTQTVSALLAEALELTRPLALEKSLQIEALSAAGALVYCDAHRIQQVLSNLLGNAVKFSPEGGSIRVNARPEDDGSIRFAIADSGQGIAPDELPRVFDRFWQAKETARAGAGLGLAICRGIVEQHGGRIWVESTLGVGTTFYFTLPSQPIPRDAPATPPPITPATNTGGP